MSALRRLGVIALFAGAIALAAPAAGGLESAAHAEGAKSTSASSKKKSAKRTSSKRRVRTKKKDRKVKVCSTSRGKRRCSYKKEFDGHGVKMAAVRAEPAGRPSGEIVFTPRNFRDETYRVNIYRPDGSFDEGALAELDRGFRCKRTGNQRAVDPRLYEMLSRIYDHFGQKPIWLVSGHRDQRNEKSRHYHAAAMDIYIEGVSIRELYKYAESLDPGGMGIGLYPRSGFVHVDFRAPGAESYRWTDYSGPDSSKSKKKKKKKTPTRVRSKNNT